MDIDLVSLVLKGGILFVLLMGGCGGTGDPPDVPAGQYSAHVEGSLSDTLDGPVHYRIRNDSLVGLELGRREGPGLSIEMEPRPLALRTYEVVDVELFGTTRPESPPGVMAFLTLDNAHFESTDGSLELTYLSGEQVGATFSFEMEGDFDQRPSEAPSVRVTGALNAPPGR